MSTDNGYLTGQLLIAMPQMRDPRFVRSVIYMCAHSSDGAMGLVVNKLMDNVTFSDLVDQLNIEEGEEADIKVHFGGPVETGRGFVLHSTDYIQDATLQINDEVALTATVDVLRDIAQGRGPQHHLLALGYAGWGAGQLDDELQRNGWLSVPADTGLVFGEDISNRWEEAVAKLGIDVSFLSGDAGHA